MAFGRWVVAAFILSALASSVLLSQGREKRVVPLPANDTQVFERTHGSVGVAILVGVGKYPRFSGFGELRYPERDVDLLAKELTSQHYQVVSLTDGDATKESILNAIRQAGEVIDPAKSSIVFFFSGHGYAQGADNMLATSDASVNKLAETGLSLRAVEQGLIATKAPRRMLWIDACRNEPGKGVGDARTFTRFQAASGTRILFSTKFGRVSYEDDEFQQGVFSHYLVEGLRGAAAKDDGWVSFRDLSDYVTEQVTTRTLQQGHTQVPFEGTGQSDASGDFPVARLVGGRAQVAAEPVSNPTSVRIKENPKDGQRYVWIPAGSYLMGCSAGDSECYDEEKPAHLVTLSKGFWMGQTAVTVGAWKRYRLATNTAELPKEDNLGRKNWNEAGPDNMPAVMMTWDEASSFCRWANMRLPTEAEWEYAARAGTTAARYGELDSIAWYGDNSGNQRIDSTQVFQADKANYSRHLFENGNFVHAVAQKQPNAWRLFDMLGNVKQWTADWYDASYYAKSEGVDPIGPPAGQYRVLRGGSWISVPQDVRASSRLRFGPGSRVSIFGCRCVGELP